ncbi:MAG: regulatory protein RecX [Pseudomonadota bacterium]
MSPSGSQNSGGRSRRQGKRSRPLDETALKDLALSYAARFATSGAKLEAYLARKIRERGVATDADGRDVQLDVPGTVARLIELGYVDDEAYARMRSRDLSARGYGARRIEQTLWAAGIEEELRQSSAPDAAAARRSAILLARKRGFGPFSRKELDLKLREKQIAAMLRAGHGFETVRFIIHSTGEEELDAWLDEAIAEAEEGSTW